MDRIYIHNKVYAQYNNKLNQVINNYIKTHFYLKFIYIGLNQPFRISCCI